MAHRILRVACLVTFAVASSNSDQTRWSRQISSYTADISDWVPLPGPVARESREPAQIKRQAVAEPRILSEPFPGFARPTGFSQEAFPSRTYYQAPSNRQLYLQSVPSVPSAPQNYLTDQGFGQSIRFGLTQPNFPLSQGFVAPQFAFDTVPQIKPRPIQPQPIQSQQIQSQPILQNSVKFENFPQNNLPSSQAKPFNPIKTDTPKFVDGYRAENVTNEYANSQKKKAQSLQKLKFENFEKSPRLEIGPSKGKLEREEVQLLYVPVESLNRGQFNLRNPGAQLTNANVYSQGLPKPSPVKQPFAHDFQRPIARPVESFSFGQDYYTNINSQVSLDQTPKFSTLTSPFPTAPPTTPKPKKLKPHQPPLAVFLTQDVKKGRTTKVGDVLLSLKNVNTIAVLDAVNPINAPKVFIGPSSLKPPENFVKFELPYLSNIENSDKKLRQLPFFVAPLSYNTPDGFAKIPFPSPHVGSVVINSQIGETTPPSTQATPSADIIPNSYSVSPASYKDTQKPTQKPTISFYSTTPKPYTESNFQSNYYSFEPQMVTSLKPNDAELITSPKSNSYFLSDVQNQYNPSQFVHFPSQSNLNPPQSDKTYNSVTTRKETTTTPRTTTTTTSSTIPSQLLETHNPYSINQAFHFSTPLDYHNYFEEYKDNFANSGLVPPPTPQPVSTSPSTTKPPTFEEIITEKPKYHQDSSPNYLQNYSPEIQYESERQSSRYPVYNSNDYTTKPTIASANNQTVNTDSDSRLVNNINLSSEYNGNIQTQATTQPTILNDNFTEKINEVTTATSDADVYSTRSPYVYNQYETIVSDEDKLSHVTTSTTTTTTRRAPLRSRGRPRYTTARTDSNESTRTVVTRRPLRERRPLPTRTKYEPNKISTEKTTRKLDESNESTTKYYRTRTRGKVHYKQNENDENYDKRNKDHKTSKENDLAYQRDILHQNYPVTLMERMSTVDIEAFTEPTSKVTINKLSNTATPSEDTENAYTNEKLAISQHVSNTESKETSSQTEGTYVPKLPSTRSDEFIYQSRSSSIPVDAISSYDEITAEKESTQTTPVLHTNKPDIISISTESVQTATEESFPTYSFDKEHLTSKEAEVTTVRNIDITKVTEVSPESEEENIVQTTPSFSRVRVRPGVVRQYHQASSTESTRTKIDRRRPAHAVTYRPAFDKRRTTMRIEEIEADLKTKQVHARPEVQEHRHPVYRPEATTSSPATSTPQDITTKRGHFRRRRPTYTTTSTESSPSVTRKNTYEVKNRFRGRRPTEKPTEKTETETDEPTTPRNILSRYSHRPKLSERYNKKPEVQDSEDQDSNYSINVPKYATPESEQWSPKISIDSFKPYNPNEIVDNKKSATTERRSDVNSELDIITARNDYDDVLISVTPATNNRVNKKIPDIPPTLEALVEQSKVTKSDSGDNMSTFESMLEEVMKSLEEQDENEYSSNVVKHKGGEIGEIPPENVITSEDNVGPKSTTLLQQEVTTVEPTSDETILQSDEDKSRKGHRRGFWKKVKVRPVTTESIEAAESQFYHHTVNQLGEYVKPSKNDNFDLYEKSKYTVTTYKPTFQFIKDIFQNDDELIDVLPTIDLSKLDNNTSANKKEDSTELPQTTYVDLEKKTPTEANFSPGELDLGTGSPDPTISEYFTTPTEKTSESTSGFSFMDYLFGITPNDAVKDAEIGLNSDDNSATTNKDVVESTKPKIVTTESTFVPEEITVQPSGEGKFEDVTAVNILKLNATESVNQENAAVTDKSVSFETSSVSSFMDPTNVVSTSMSTEISHETEICFRGKCIKTNKDINL